jgi:hypothetical protein
MLAGMPAVFLSCSEKFKTSVAVPIKNALAEVGVRGIIVSDEPSPDSIDWDPDSKVEWFLNASDAVVSLCTADNRLEDGTIECRPNIIDEIQRARQKPHLARKIQVLKSQEVHLPSNINPTYDQLDSNSPQVAISVILRQLNEWGVLPRPQSGPVVTDAQTSTRDVTRELQLHEMRLRRRGHYGADDIDALDKVLQSVDELLTGPSVHTSDLPAPAPLRASELTRDAYSSLQLYDELLQASPKLTPRRAPGGSPEHRPLSEISSDRATLLEAKEQLQTSVVELAAYLQKH